MSWLKTLLNIRPLQRGRESASVPSVPVPTLWLYGKTASGKSSIIRYLTHATDAEIGEGFRPCTRTSRRYSFPDDEAPLVTFLDTRGLGEARYDPHDDLQQLSHQAQLIVVTVRVTDHALDEILPPLRELRQANPQRPVLLVLTCLHDAYPGQQHPEARWLDVDRATLSSGLTADVPAELRRSLEAQCARWGPLVDEIVAVDLTSVEDGFDTPDFGGDRLKRAIVSLLPAAYRQTLIELDKLSGQFRSTHRRTASQMILSHSVLAASAAAVPVPWIDIPAVLAIQSNLAHRLARLNRHELDAATLARVTAAVGGRVAIRMGVREALKIVPWIGAAANAASCFALTYAAGRAWNWYFTEMNQGHIPSNEELRNVYREQLARAATLWQTTHVESPQ